jgi:hypothetical protein
MEPPRGEPMGPRKIFAREEEKGMDLRATVACSTCYFREDSKKTGGPISRTPANLENNCVRGLWELLGLWGKPAPGARRARRRIGTVTPRGRFARRATHVRRDAHGRSIARTGHGMNAAEALSPQLRYEINKFDLLRGKGIIGSARW